MYGIIGSIYILLDLADWPSLAIEIFVAAFNLAITVQFSLFFLLRKSLFISNVTSY